MGQLEAGQWTWLVQFGCEIRKAWMELEDARIEKRVMFSTKAKNLHLITVFTQSMKQKSIRNGFPLKDALMIMSQ